MTNGMDVSLEDSMICNCNPTQVAGFYNDQGGNTISDDCCLQDLNHDGVVGAADLTMLISLWGTPCLGCQADQNDDGVINATDLAELLTSWGQCG